MDTTVQWPYFDPDFANFSQRINPPRVTIDNHSCSSATIVKVDSANKNGILLEVVQALTDLKLSISKAYISSDGGWFMDVFHVTDQNDRKITDDELIQKLPHYLQDKLTAAANGFEASLSYSLDAPAPLNHTVMELIGTDRPGLLSEIFAVLTNLNCNVVCAEIWTHNTRVACVVNITDQTSSGPIKDPERLNCVKEQLSNVLRATGDNKTVKTASPGSVTNVERRLHQMMFADRDYEGLSSIQQEGKTCITIENCSEKGYSVVNVRCKDRPKLLFDVVCTLTDMQYVVSHASISSEGPYAAQEYYIRHLDGCILDTQGEQERVIRCLEAAVERRASQGVRLELCTSDRVGLLSDVTRIFREHGLSVARADVTTVNEKAMNTFYVISSSGGEVDAKTIETVRSQIGQQILYVKGLPESDITSETPDVTKKFLVSFGSLIKSQWDRFSSHLRLVKPCS